MRVGRAAVLLAAAILVSACRTLQPGVPLERNDPLPAMLLERWEASVGGRQALRGRLRLSVDADGEGHRGGDVRIRSKQVVVIARPASLRVEILGFLNTTAAVLTTDGDRYQLLRTEDHSFESGPVHEALLWEVARIGLSPDDAVELLLGAPRPGAGLRVAGALRMQDSSVRIALSDAPQPGAAERAALVRREVEFDPEGRLSRIEVRDAAGEVAWEARFDDYGWIDSSPFAHRLALDLPADGARAELSLRDVELNPALGPEVFRIRPPTQQGRLREAAQ